LDLSIHQVINGKKKKYYLKRLDIFQVMHQEQHDSKVWKFSLAIDHGCEKECKQLRTASAILPLPQEKLTQLDL